MSTRLWTEVTCDHCGQADFAMHNKKGEKRLISTAEQMRKQGWIFTRGGLHFDNETCRRNYLLAPYKAKIA
jgi:hypothetical protein